MMGMKHPRPVSSGLQGGPDRMKSKAKILADLMQFTGKGSAEGLKDKFAPKPPEPAMPMHDDEAMEGEAPESEGQLASVEGEMNLDNLDPETLKQLLAQLGLSKEG